MKTSKGMTRRDLLKASASAGVAAFLAGCSPEAREVYFRRRFLELTPDQVRDILVREEKAYGKQFSTPVSVRADPPLDGVA